ncbi:MAG TPA: hypothetical protein VLH77_00735 [Gammaproteobacteria bacterium]|nr:hypothetical protein [Gammaproteobacteria bacterium]
MNAKIIFILSLTIFISGKAFGSSKCDSFHPQIPSAEEIEVQIPFTNQAVNNGDYDDGLCFSYRMKQNSNQKVVCTFINFNEGWTLFKENNITKESATYSGSKTIIFTQIGVTQVISEKIDQYHVDENGLIAIHHSRDYNYPQNHVTASCHYELG